MTRRKPKYSITGAYGIAAMALLVFVQGVLPAESPILNDNSTETTEEDDEDNTNQATSWAEYHFTMSSSEPFPPSSAALAATAALPPSSMAAASLSSATTTNPPSTTSAQLPFHTHLIDAMNLLDSHETDAPASGMPAGATHPLTSKQTTSKMTASSNTVTSKPTPFFPEWKRRKTHDHTYHSKYHREHHLGPFFEEPLKVTQGAFQVGVYLATEAVLNCRVGMLKDKTVMWIRKNSDKFSLLTVGNNTYSGDRRINVRFQYPNNWRLHINPVQRDDAGMYTCQVSTHPPRVFSTNVTVLDPALRIVDEQGHEVSDRYYKIGSTIELTCQLSISFLSSLANSVTPPNLMSSSRHTIAPPKSVDIADRQDVIWRKDSSPLALKANINYSISTDWHNIRLSMENVERKHSGLYECSFLNATSAVVDVQILNGETPAAVQHSNSISIHWPRENKYFAIVVIVVVIAQYISSW